MERQFKVLQVGCGGISGAWTPHVSARADVTYVGAVDIRLESAQAFVEKYNLNCPVFSDLEEALRGTGANLVIDNTIPESHHRVVTSALRAGCDVLGEKPLAASLAEARDMVDTARSTGHRYSVMQNRRYIRNNRSFADIVQSGVIGQPGFIQSDFFLGAHFGGFRDIMDSPLLLDMAIHTFDQARFVTGGIPVSVYCQEFNPPGSWYKGNAGATAIFEFSNGMVYTYSGSWCATGCNTTWECTWRVSGTAGSACWNGADAPWYEIPEEDNNPASFIWKTRKVTPEATWNGNEGHQGCIDEMFAALCEGRKAETDCTDNIHSLAIVLAAIDSAKTGRKVIIDLNSHHG